jgi:hypothetical protein
MKTSDPAAYSHIEQITAGATVLSVRGLLLTGANASSVLAGTTWEKVAGTTDTYKTFSITIDMSAAKTLVLPLSVRTLTTITNVTVYGMR